MIRVLRAGVTEVRRGCAIGGQDARIGISIRTYCLYPPPIYPSYLLEGNWIAACFAHNSDDQHYSNIYINKSEKISDKRVANCHWHNKVDIITI